MSTSRFASITVQTAGETSTTTTITPASYTDGTMTIATGDISGVGILGATTITGTTINASSTFTIGGVAVTATPAEINTALEGCTSTYYELNYLDLTTGVGTAEANKALVLNGSSMITTGISSITSTNFVTDSAMTLTGQSIIDVTTISHDTKNITITPNAVLIVGTSGKFTVDISGAGDVYAGGTLQSMGSFTVGSSKFTVDASSGDVVTTGVVSIHSSMMIASGSITDSGGSISFGDETLTTTGTISGGSGSSFGNIMVSDGYITCSGGTISFGDENLTTTGTITSVAAVSPTITTTYLEFTGTTREVIQLATAGTAPNSNNYMKITSDGDAGGVGYVLLETTSAGGTPTTNVNMQFNTKGSGSITLNAASSVTGTLSVTGISTFTGLTNHDGGIDVDGTLTVGSTEFPGVVDIVAGPTGISTIYFSGASQGRGGISYNHDVGDESLVIRCKGADIMELTASEPEDYNAWNEYSFTASHKVVPADEALYDKKYEGRCLCSTGRIRNLDDSTKPTIEESLPILQLCCHKKCRGIMGVVATDDTIEIDGDGKEIQFFWNGKSKSKRLNPSTTKRLKALGLGEGGVWVDNTEGNVEIGDLLMSSGNNGYACVQDSEAIMSYTIGKAVMPCDFKTDRT